MSLGIKFMYRLIKTSCSFGGLPLGSGKRGGGEGVTRNGDERNFYY